jgi:hypothetical protein
MLKCGKVLESLLGRQEGSLRQGCFLVGLRGVLSAIIVSVHFNWDDQYGLHKEKTRKREVERARGLGTELEASTTESILRQTNELTFRGQRES